MSSFSRKFLAFCGVAALLFIAVINGGCGGGSSSFIPGGSDSDSNINTVLPGGWRLDTSANNSISADINGTTVNVTIREFAANFSSVDVTSSGGIAYFEAASVMSSDRVVLPFLLEATKVDLVTSELEYNTWIMSNKDLDFLYTLTLDESSSTPKIILTGIFNLAGDGQYIAYITVTLSKVNETPKTPEQINELLNGTWQTPYRQGIFTGGGFVYMSGDIAEAPAGGEVPSDKVLIDDMTAIDAVFTNIIFDSSDIVNNTAEITYMGLFAFLRDDDEWASGNEAEAPVIPMFNNGVAEIKYLFGNIYEITYNEYDGNNDKDYIFSKSILMIDDNGTKAYLISCYIEKDSDLYTETRAVHALEKKDEESIYTLEDQDGKIWSTVNDASATGAIIKDSTSQPIDIDKIEIMFNNVGLDALNLRIAAEYHLLTGNIESSDLQKVSFDLLIDGEITELGYNAWYAATSDGEDFTITFLSENLAIIAVNFVSPASNQNISCVAFIKCDGTIKDAFFNGAWTSTTSDAKVNMIRQGSNINVALLNFGAYFSSVDIESGTANFSAFTVLSSDLFILPVVFDNENVSIDLGTTEDEYIVKTQNGSFTVTRDDNNSDKLNIKGSLAYFSNILTISIDATATKFQANRRLDFNSIMNQSTWQSTPFDSKSGGFAVIGNLSSLMLYPGASSKSFADFAFNGDETSGEFSGFGTMGLLSFDFETRQFNDDGYMLPITFIKDPVKVANVFGNYYRFEFESGDAELKGVFILESESNARMILLADSGNDTTITRLHTIFSLNKVTESAQIDLTAFNNTSWDVTQAGGVVSLQDGNVLQITNSEPDIYNIKLYDFMLEFMNADFAAKTFEYKISAYCDLPVYGVTNQNVIIPEKTVTVEKVGSYMWYGKQDDNEFILTMSAEYPDRAALAGKLHFLSPNNPNFSVASSLLLDLVPHK